MPERQVVDRPLVKSAYKNIFSYFLTKTYVVGTQKNRLNDKTYVQTYGLENT